VPGPKDQVKADKDPPEKAESGELTADNCFTGSVVGIQIEVVAMHTGTMHTGTLISDLMATVERAEEKAREIVITQELHAIFAMEIPMPQGNVFMGAA
jgi:hypothetical protein